MDSKLLEILGKVWWGTLAAIASACGMSFALDWLDIVLVPSSSKWIIALAGLLSGFLLVYRLIERIQESRKNKPHSFKKLTKIQRDFLIGCFRSGSNVVETDSLYKFQWFDELYNLNYLKTNFYNAEITHDGWKEVETYLRRRDS